MCGASSAAILFSTQSLVDDFRWLCERWQPLGVRGRLLIFAVVVALPLAIVGAVELQGIWTASRTQLNESVRKQAELAAIAFARWVDAQQEPLATIAAEEKIDAASIKNDLLHLMQSRRHWIDVRVVSGSGETIAAEPPDRESPPPALINYLISETRNRRSWLVVTDRTRNDSPLVLAIATPTRAGGAVIARIDGVAISELFRDIQLRDGSVIAVFDAQGRILYRGQTTETPLDREVSGSPLFESLGDQRVALVELESPYDGIRRVYGLARTGITQSVVVVGIPSATLYEPATRRFRTYLFLSLLTFVGALLAGLFIARGIIRPIRELNQTAQAFGADDPKARASVNASGEIGELGSAFNRMADQISEREERLKELDRLKSEFVSSVSHELRTPLTTIKTLTHVLQRGGYSTEEQQEYLETIAAECDRQIDLVLNLLDLSRIESGAYRIAPTRINAAEVMMAAVMQHEQGAELRGQQLKLDLPPELPGVKSDKAALRRALGSLIENAIKYTPEGGQITVGATVRKGEVAFYVEDTGCGIHPEDVPRIFEKFYRGRPMMDAENGKWRSDSVALGEQPGVGLGLYLVRNLVDQMGGRIDLETMVKRGTKFTLYLKAENDPVTEPSQTMNAEESIVEEVARS